jgi:hypothetical protein
MQASIHQELGHTEPDWRLRNACPPCTYQLEDEPRLKYSILLTLDGNNSLKRVPRSIRHKDENGKLLYLESIECQDNHTKSDTGGLYLTEAEVDEYSHEVRRRLPPADIDVSILLL